MIEGLLLCWLVDFQKPGDVYALAELMVFLMLVELMIYHHAHYNVWTPIHTPIGRAFPYFVALAPLMLVTLFTIGWITSFILRGFTGKRLDLKLYYPRSEGWKIVR